MYRRVSEEITAPIWEGYLEPRSRRVDDVTTGMRPRPIAAALDADPEPTRLDDPAVLLAVASVLGLLASALAAVLGFMVGVLVA
jgi:hypothetical protein